MGKGRDNSTEKKTKKQKQTVGAELGCDSARSTEKKKKKAIGLSGTKKVGGEKMTRAVSAREGEARKEPVLVLSLQMEPMCLGSCWKLVLITLQIQNQSQDT